MLQFKSLEKFVLPNPYAALCTIIALHSFHCHTLLQGCIQTMFMMRENLNLVVRADMGGASSCLEETAEKILCSCRVIFIDIFDQILFKLRVSMFGSVCSIFLSFRQLERVFFLIAGGAVGKFGNRPKFAVHSALFCLEWERPIGDQN